MSKRYSVEKLAPIITETLNGNGSVSFVLGGISMLPAIRDGIDTVTLVKPHKLKKGDVIFYQRDNGQYILHRVICVDGDTYITRGDNQWVNDYNVRDNQIIGVLKSVERNGRIYDADSFKNKVYLLFLPVIRWILRICNAVKRRL